MASQFFVGLASCSFDLGRSLTIFIRFSSPWDMRILLVPRRLCVELDDSVLELALLLEVLLFVGTFTPTDFWLLSTPLLPAVGDLDLIALQTAVLLGGSVSLVLSRLHSSWL